MASAYIYTVGTINPINRIRKNEKTQNKPTETPVTLRSAACFNSALDVGNQDATGKSSKAQLTGRVHGRRYSSCDEGNRKIRRHTCVFDETNVIKDEFGNLITARPPE